MSGRLVVEASAPREGEVAPDVINDPTVEHAWAAKAFRHADKYYRRLRECADVAALSLTECDDALYAAFRERFPDMPVGVVREDDLKSAERKAEWRALLMQFEKRLSDYHYATLLRLDAAQAYGPENSCIVPRVQFAMIELARNREGHNRELPPAPQDDDDDDDGGGAAAGASAEGGEGVAGSSVVNASWSSRFLGGTEGTIDLSPAKDSGVLVRVVQPGSGPAAPQGADAYVWYRGWLDNGMQFDFRPESNPLEVSVGSDKVIEAWQLLLPTMSKGQRVRMCVQPAFGYGDAPTNGRIPPNSVLLFEVAMVDFVYAQPATNAVETHAAAGALKTEGATLFVAGDAAGARRRWDKAYALEDALPAVERDAALVLALNLNLAAAFNKLGRFDDAAECCRAVLDVDAKNVKARFRLAEALLHTNDLDGARELLAALAAEQPSSADVRELKKTLARKTDEERQRMRRMLGVASSKAAPS